MVGPQPSAPRGRVLASLIRSAFPGLQNRSFGPRRFDRMRSGFRSAGVDVLDGDRAATGDVDETTE